MPVLSLESVYKNNGIDGVLNTVLETVLEKCNTRNVVLNKDLVSENDKANM